MQSDDILTFRHRPKMDNMVAAAARPFRESLMKRTARILMFTAIFGFSASITSAEAAGARSGAWTGWSTRENSWGFGYGFCCAGPAYYGDYDAHRVYDGYFAYEYPVLTGSDVTAIGVGFINSRWRHRRVVGPGVVYYRGQLPRPQHVYW